MRNYVLLTDKSWYDDLFDNLTKRSGEKWTRIGNREDFNLEALNSLRPEQIYIPHWSYIIPLEIYDAYTCIVFHMTDLPYGRGGSPLQNLIVRGHKQTMISAIRVDEGIDTGPIYLKKPLLLSGMAQEIFGRASLVIEKMIQVIIDKNLNPTPQIGEPVFFERRKPGDGCMNKLTDLEQVYNYIRMLDAEGYPPAFIETEKILIEFKGARMNNNSEIQANVRITKK